MCIYERRAQSIVKSDPQHSVRRRHLLGVLALWTAALTAVLMTPAFAEQEYLLAPGDILKITVFKNTDLSLDVRVSEAGLISYPLIGSVPVSGLTLPAAERKIAQMLRDGGFVVNPQVNILLTQAFGNLVSVIGEVNTAGRYSLDAAGGHLSGMLAAAGGGRAGRGRAGWWWRQRPAGRGRGRSRGGGQICLRCP